MQNEEMNKPPFKITSSLFSAKLNADNMHALGVFDASPSPSDGINIALIGSNSRAFNVLKAHLDHNDVICSVLRDVGNNLLDKRAAGIRNKIARSVLAPALYSPF